MQTTCPRTTTIADLVDGHLSPAEIAEVERHIDDCSCCADLVAMAVTRDPGGSTATSPAGAASARLADGTRLGRYEIRRWIGRGGMGDVYESFDHQLERRVALKVLRGPTSDEQARRRLTREAKAMARLSSPRVVTVIDLGVFQDHVFLVMELVEGQTLAQWLHSAPRTWRQILHVFLAAGEGLAAAHDVGVIHRDFKPQNVLVATNGDVRVTDFGLAHLLAAPSSAGVQFPSVGAPASTTDGTATQTDAIAGTPRYMAPEQRLGLVVDARTDQFSLCVALWEAIRGQHPFPNDAGAFPQPRPTSNNQAPPPKTPQIPKKLTAAIVRGLSKNPVDRFPSIRELLAVMRRTSSRHRKRFVIAGGAAAATAALAAIWFSMSASALTVIEPEGQPADWTSIPVFLHVPDRLHCFSRLDERTIRIVWGSDRKAEEVDVYSGQRRPSDLTPESYRHGCPEESPDGRQLIYEGYDDRGRASIFHATNPSGQHATPVVASARPTFASEPLWLSSNNSFVFDADAHHAAVYSLDTKTTTVLSGPETPSQGGYFKTTSLVGDKISTNHPTTTPPGVVLRIYRWPTLDLESTLRIHTLASATWRFTINPTSLIGSVSTPPTYSVAQLDLKDHRLVLIGRLAAYRSTSVLPTAPGVGVAVGHKLSVNIVFRDNIGHESTIPSIPDGHDQSPFVTPDGTILFTRYYSTGPRAMAFSQRDKSIHSISPERDCHRVSALPNGELILSSHTSPNSGIFLCGRTGSNCQLISTEAPFEVVPAPDGTRIAILLVDRRGPLVRLLSPAGQALLDVAGPSTICRPYWSGPRNLWISVDDGGRFTWTEIDVETNRPTGRTAPGTTGCYDGEEDPHPPLPQPVRVHPAFSYDFRLVSLPLH